jgi:peptidyl-prolyl cis-trans isomerase B (cyclophilin B)
VLDVLELVLSALLIAQAPAQKAGFFTTTLPADAMRDKQAVVETNLGTFVIDLLADAAPNHVGYFMKLASEGAYDGTAFHRIIKHGIIQGGDPLSKDPARVKQYGTGGLGVLKFEASAEQPTRGAVAAVLVPGKADSAGSQFFICVTDQPALAGQYTVFGRVSDGLDVVTRISEVPADADARPSERVTIRSVRLRDRPPPEPIPFETETPEELARYRAVIETAAGAITLEFFPDKAPAHVRNFLRLAATGVYDGTTFHRVVRGFVIQGGSLEGRAPLTNRQQKVVTTLAPEFNDTKHEKGILSMARGDDPASASTSFFICTGPAPSLDGKYTAFGRVVAGLSAVEAIEAGPVTGETPATRIEIARIRVEGR